MTLCAHEFRRRVTPAPWLRNCSTCFMKFMALQSSSIHAAVGRYPRACVVCCSRQSVPSPACFQIGAPFVSSSFNRLSCIRLQQVWSCMGPSIGCEKVQSTYLSKRTYTASQPESLQHDSKQCTCAASGTSQSSRLIWISLLQVWACLVQSLCFNAQSRVASQQ